MAQFLHEGWAGEWDGADLGVVGAGDVRVDLADEFRGEQGASARSPHM
ncbi:MULTISPECIES: hypothetical protein [unclassified Streptomyces]|nr:MULTISPECIES: hypothetical protein [unclassified Streptomyces]MCX5052131.1 hypothetical protein [Streptomyces sp. NBC_00474]MCX5251287.1 hypothetical protein [Streptomyces sp. NBC_00201]MCX5294790.1 hypothetical protein [Streptomyces sp. NBC_00183]